jgi:hypothetical protein
MAQFRIEVLYHGAWQLFGWQVQQLGKNRDTYLARLKRRLGSEMAEKIVQHVEVSCGRLLPLPKFRDPDIMTMPEFFGLLALERSLLEIKRRIEENAVFYDFHLELLTTLGISEQDVQNLIDGQQSPGYLPVENVQKLTAMVLGAKQKVIGDADDRKFYRQRRRELVQFLQRVLLVGEPLFCEV